MIDWASVFVQSVNLWVEDKPANNQKLLKLLFLVPLSDLIN